MARIATKHANTRRLSFPFTGGLRADVPANAIKMEEASDILNMWYDSGDTSLTVRPGLSYISRTGATPFVVKNLLSIYTYQKDVDEAWLIGVCEDGDVLSCDPGKADSPSSLPKGGTSWASIGSITAGVIPGMATFGGELIIADPNTELKKWTGTGSMTTITGSPYASALANVGGGRLAANSATDLDAVIMCGPEDVTDWNVATGNAELVRVGYGDGMAVVGMVMFNSDLIVFKKGEAGGMIMRLANANGDPSTWAVLRLASGDPLTNAQSVVVAANNVFYGTSHGVKDLAGVTMYGDINEGTSGRPINNLLLGKQIKHLAHCPSRGVIMVVVDGTDYLYVYHTANKNWTVFQLNAFVAYCCCEYSNQIMLGGKTTLQPVGRLFRVSYNNATDAVISSADAIRSRVRGRQVIGGALVTGTRLSIESFSGVNVTLGAVQANGLDVAPLLTWTGDASGGMLYEATGYLYDATGKLGVESRSHQRGVSRWRGDALTIDITGTGRYRLQQVDVDVATVR